jgi:hypothetical protein
VDCDENVDNGAIKAWKSKSVIFHKTDQSPPTSHQKTSTVQCWLCDGPHSFRQCSELNHMKSVCIKRPSVLKHFQQLLLKKNGEAIRILMEAPEFVDDATLSTSHNDNEVSLWNPSENNDQDEHMGIDD